MQKVKKTNYLTLILGLVMFFSFAHQTFAWSITANYQIDYVSTGVDTYVDIGNATSSCEGCAVVVTLFTIGNSSDNISINGQSVTRYDEGVLNSGSGGDINWKVWLFEATSTGVLPIVANSLGNPSEIKHNVFTISTIVGADSSSATISQATSTSNEGFIQTMYQSIAGGDVGLWYITAQSGVVFVENNDATCVYIQPEVAAYGLGLAGNCNAYTSGPLDLFVLSGGPQYWRGLIVSLPPSGNQPTPSPNPDYPDPYGVLNGWGQNVGTDTPTYPCGVADIGGCFANAGIWLFYPASSTVQEIRSLTLASSTPFSYVYDTKVIYDELLGQSSTSSLKLELTGLHFVPGATSSITIISPEMIEAVPFAERMRSLIGFVMWLLMAQALWLLPKTRNPLD